MVQTLNFINLSSQQAPNDVDWAGLVNSGVQGVLIRLGHGIIRDPCASGHIAKAKQYGLYWHGYHTYEGVVNEPQFTIKNATELGLSTSQYYFVDLTKSSDPFNDYYALHANWLSQGYSTGLLISSNDYLSKFTDSDVTASGTLRWLISDTEPANYDIWQYSSEGTIGTSSVKVGFNFAKTDKLKYNLNTTLTGADISKDPYNPQAPVGGAYIGWGYDTTGLGGGKTIGYSTNGKNFYALIGPDGLIVRKSDGNRIYGTISDQIDSAISANVIPAKSAADSAVSAADAAVASAQVTSDAVTAIASATAEAKQGANDAMSRAESAWDVATGAKEAVTDFDPLLKSAQSDASKALTQIADTASALSDAKTSFGSDVAEAKELANTAQTTANSAVESAGENARELASQATALSDAREAMDSGVASAMGMANVAQTTADNAIKSAASVANDLAVVASQANANASGITKVTSDVGLLQTTVADNSGNISTIQETAKQIQQAVSDNAGNITTAKQTADSAVAVASDARSNATVANQTASQASITANNASGQAASAVITANGAMTTASDAKSDATVAIQTASGASLTATNAKNDATVAKQTASEAKVQASNAESDFAQLSIRANKIEANVATNSGAIASVQQTANGLTTTVADIKANGGGVNLAKGTSSKDQSYGDASQTTGWNIITIATFDNPQAGQQYTISVNTRNNGGSWKIQFWDGTSPTQRGKWLSSGNNFTSTQGQKQTATITWPSGSNKYLLVQLANSNDGGQIVWNSAMLEEGAVAHTWSPAHDDVQNQFTQIKESINGVTTIINDPKTGLNATYQTAAGNATTISNVKSDVYQLETTANGLTSRVGNLESKTNTQQTAIEQNKNAITLKADQTNVDTLKGTVNQLQSSLTVQAGQIQTKVSASDVSGMLKGYATQEYTQSLVTQKAGEWNLNLASLQTDVNAIKTTGGGRNLIANTGTDIVIDATSNVANNFAFVGLNFTEQPKQGDLITVSAEGTLTGTGTLDEYQVVLYNVSTTNSRSQAQYLKAGKRDSVTLSLDNLDGDGDTILLIYAGKATETGGKKNVIHHLMVEKGTVAHDWSPATSDMATVTSVTNLSATVNGIQSQVYNSDGSSKITQLSNLIQSKVGTDDFNNLKQAVDLQTLDSADINNMKANGHYFVHNLANNPIGGWVYVDVTGDGSSRIRQDVYQDNGTKHKYRRWFDTYRTDWEEGATYTEINQLQDAINLRVTKGDLISQINLQAGTALIQSNKLVLDAGTTIITGNAFIPSAAISSISADKIMLGSSSLWNSDGTLNLLNQSNGLKALIQVKQGLVQNTTQSIISFSSDYNNRAFSVTPVGATITPTLFFERYDQTAGHWLGFTRNEVRRDGLMFHTWDDEGERFFVGCHARFDRNISAAGTINQGTWNGTTGKPLAGILTITAGNTIWSGSDFLAIGDHVSNGYTNVIAKSFSQQSTLSSKTNIETVDPKDALDLVNRTDIRSYQYKTDVAEGKTKRYTSLIIDDVNDVSEYYAPDEFTNEERTGRDDGSAVGYLFLAIQELTRRIKTLEEKLNG